LAAGIPGGKTFQGGCRTGGPLGGLPAAKFLNTLVDFDSLQQAGAVMDRAA